MVLPSTVSSSTLTGLLVSSLYFDTSTPGGHAIWCAHFWIMMSLSSIGAPSMPELGSFIAFLACITWSQCVNALTKTGWN